MAFFFKIVSVKTCQLLHTLHIDHCLPLSDDDFTELTNVGLKQLQVIRIKGTALEPKALQTLRGEMHTFKQFQIQQCFELN